MSKRFPIPEFDRDQYKNMAWQQPRLLSREEQAKLIEAARAGKPEAFGCHAVEADDAFYDRFALKGPHRHAVMCLTPPGKVRLVGRSWAWPIQRAVVVDSLDAGKAQVLQEWKTPRPMNTRLGPDNGVEIEGGVTYAVFGHRYSDYWIANRTLADTRAANGRGFSVVSATGDENNDFHACNLSFSWA
ncbi:MAG TPA: hypothetical protein VEC19_19745 [Usitatibacter sp.]|nr:hypothetical protein [Usitatibacter sp.]